MAVVVVGVAWCAGIVSAHAELITATPGNGDVVEAAPEEILLEFSESVDPIDPGIRLVDAAGNAVDIAATDQDRGASTMRAAVPEALADGTYVVAWQAVSADSHRIRGAYTFSVGEATATAPGVVEDLFDAEPDGPADALGLGVGRFLSYAGIGLFVGLLTMATLLAPELVATRRGRYTLIAAIVSALIGTVVMILMQAHLITGSVASWRDVADTQSGRWWFFRLVAVIALGALMVVWSRLGRARRAAMPLAGLGALAIVAAGGHGISGDAVTAGYVATVVHLAAMATWIGGLTLIVLAERGGHMAMAARVSPFALGSVVALAVTGSLNAWRQLDGFASIADSVYGRWLIIKLVLVVAVLWVALVSRWLVRRASAASPDTAATESPTVVRTVAVELVGMALILMATAGLVNSSPPEDEPTIASASAVVGNRIAQIELDPAVTGGTELHVYVTSPSGGLDRADEITVTAELPSADLGPLDLETRPAGPNHVIGTDVDLPIAGEWTFVVRARYGDFEQVAFTMELAVSD